MSSFSKGDRVILDGLQSAAYLNGMHGCVAEDLNEAGRHVVDLDLLLEPPKRLRIKPSNLRQEPPISSKRRADVAGGSLIEQEGRALSLLLDCMRLVTASFVEPELETTQDIENLRLSPEGFAKQNHLTSTAWSFWREPNGYHGMHADGICGGLRDLVKNQLPEMNGGLEALIAEKPEYKRCVEAVDDGEACQGWNVRVTGDFWIVGMDEGGTFLIPDGNRDVVYQCCGVKDPIYPKVAHFGRPSLFRVTMIPWYGRLVYDGVLYPGGPGAMRGPPKIASPRLAETLHSTVEQCKREGRVLQRLAQLEVAGGSPKGVQDLSSKPDSIAAAADTKATAEEKKLVKKIARVRVPPRPAGQDPVMWVARRMGYTEWDNPDHHGVMLQTDGRAITVFSCSALAPTSIDILKAIVESCRLVGSRPHMIGIDDKACFQRVKFLLESVDGSDAFYYAPPSAEETMAASALGRMGLNS